MVVITVANPATSPVLVETRKGLNYFYWLDSTDIKGQIQARNGDVLVPTFTAVSGVDVGTGIAADESFTQGRVWRIGLLFSQGGNLLYQTSTDGQIFS